MDDDEITLTPKQLEEIRSLIEDTKQSIIKKHIVCCGVGYHMPEHERAFWNHKKVCKAARAKPNLEETLH